MPKIFLRLVIPALVMMPASAIAGELKLTMENGLVTLIADNVPLSTIMAEWARVGQTQIVNGDKIMTPMSLHIVATPERKALDILLRQASGYMLAERATPLANASVFDRIMILPTSRPPANVGPLAPPPTFAPSVPRPMPTPVPVTEDDEPAVMPQPNPGTGQPMPGQPPGTPNAPLMAPRPGQLPAPPPQQPVPFGTPRPGTGRGGGPGGVPATGGGGGGGGGGVS